MTLGSFVELVGKTCNRKQELTLPGSSATSSVNPPLLLTIIKLLKVVALLSWGRFSYARARPRSWNPIPRTPSEVGADIIYVDTAHTN